MKKECRSGAGVQDVARHAQVGIATVSRVLNGNGYVSEKTREKVLQAVRELNYVPNELARNLLQNRTDTIAVIVPDIMNPFFATFVNRAELALRREGYRTLLCNTIGERSNELAYLNMLERNMVDGIITASHLLHSHHYARVRRPIVALDRVLSGEIPTVCSDHAEGGRRAAELLIRAGCRHIAQFRDNLDEQLEKETKNERYRDPLLRDFPFVQRHVEFEAMVRDAGLAYSEFTTAWEGGFANHRQLQELVARGFHAFDGVDGIMATDNLAVKLVRLAHAHGTAIPADLKIVSYDGTYLMDMCNPPLSVIAQPIEALADKAVELLLKQINGEQIEQMRVILPIAVYEGESTA